MIFSKESLNITLLDPRPCKLESFIPSKSECTIEKLQYILPYIKRESGTHRDFTALINL